MPTAATSGLPFDDIRALMAALPEVASGGPARLALWPGAVRAGAAGTSRPVVAVFIASHGAGVRELSGQAETEGEQHLATLQGGGAEAAKICAAAGLGLKVFELALAHPAADILAGPSLEEADCAATMAYGMEAVAGGCDLLGLSGFAVGGGLAAAALCAALFGGPGEGWLATPEGPLRKAQGAALLAIAGEGLDPLEALRRFGGREIAALAGAILAARLERVPVVVEGVAALAAAAVLKALNPASLAHVRVASCEDAVAAELARRLGLAVLIGVPTGEAPGMAAALALATIKAAGDAL